MNHELLALVPLPVEGELEMLRTGPLPLRDVLALSPFLSEEAAIPLLRSRRPSSQWRAIRRISDGERLTRYIRNGSAARAAAAARNPATPTDALDDALGSTADHVVLAALVNPSTPEESRLRVADRDTVDRLVNVGGSLGHSVIRAAEVVLNNPWMTETPEVWDGATQRAIASSPDADVSALKRLRAVSRFGGKFLRSHPLLRNEGSTWDSYTTDELIQCSNPAADLQAMRRDDFVLLHARRMFGRETDPVEPQVLARIIDRFGFAASSGMLRKPFAGTRISAAQWTTPSTWYLEYTHVSATRFAETTDAVAALGADRDRWSTFLALLPTWQLSLTKLAETAYRLCR